MCICYDSKVDNMRQTSERKHTPKYVYKIIYIYVCRTDVPKINIARFTDYFILFYL